MAEVSNIEWTDATFNPWMGCTKVSPACDHCYAEELMDTRYGKVHWGAGKPRVRTGEKNWNLPLRWNKRLFLQCTGCGHRYEGGERDNISSFVTYACPKCDCEGYTEVRRRVFCASLADVFDNEVDVAWRLDLFELIHATPNLDWLLLTKRIGNVMKMLAECLALAQSRGDRPMLVERLSAWIEGAPPANVWIGATIVNQEEADRDIPKLLAVPARVRFLSMEPLLGPVDLAKDIGGTRWLGGQRGCAGTTRREHRHDDLCGPGIDWVIVGGESGPGARAMHPDWARSLRDQCAAVGVPFLFKQWGEFTAHQVDPESYAAHLSCIDGDGRECALSRGDQALAKGEGWWFLPPHPGRGTWGPDGIPAGVVEVRRVGKKAAGRLLDGAEHNGVPEVLHG